MEKTEDTKNISKKYIFPIQPINPLKREPLKNFLKYEKIDISKISPFVGTRTPSEIPRAVVAFFDVLGFSYKKNDIDIEFTIIDFSAPLILLSCVFKKIRFNIFSDCAFVAAHLKNADELLSIIRYAFSRWISNGLLIRGGIAKGNYKEIYHIALDLASNNFTGNLLYGSAVTRAVRLEGSGSAALLFTHKECADFYRKKFHEPIFTLDNSRIIGWSDDENVLFWFIGISFLRLLQFLALENGEKNSVAIKLLNNIRFTKTILDNNYVKIIILSLLTLPGINHKSYNKAIKIFHIKDPKDFNYFQNQINDFFNEREEDIKLLRNIAHQDSSLPFFNPQVFSRARKVRSRRGVRVYGARAGEFNN